MSVRARVTGEMEPGMSFDQLYEFAPLGEDALIAGDTCQVKTDRAGHCPVQLRTKDAQHTVIATLHVWVVWAEKTSVDKGPLEAAEPEAETGARGNFKEGFAISGLIRFRFKILPTDLITASDHPALEGENKFNGSAVPPPGAALNHIVSNLPFSGGANTKWDLSRRLRMKVLNPNGYKPSVLPYAPGGAFSRQPVAEDTPAQFPDATSVIGNDDTSQVDEDTNPYQPFQGDPSTSDQYKSHGVGELADYDLPIVPLADLAGTASGQTFELRYQFGEFVRLLIGNQWYQCSDFVDWRLHAKFKLLIDAWTNDQSQFELNNDNF